MKPEHHCNHGNPNLQLVNVTSVTKVDVANHQPNLRYYELISPYHVHIPCEELFEMFITVELLVFHTVFNKTVFSI